MSAKAQVDQDIEWAREVSGNNRVLMRLVLEAQAVEAERAAEQFSDGYTYSIKWYGYFSERAAELRRKAKELSVR